jgi:hypothetical protein
MHAHGFTGLRPTRQYGLARVLVRKWRQRIEDSAARFLGKQA